MKHTIAVMTENDNSNSQKIEQSSNLIDSLKQEISTLLTWKERCEELENILKEQEVKHFQQICRQLKEKQEKNILEI